MKNIIITVVFIFISINYILCQDYNKYNKNKRNNRLDSIKSPNVRKYINGEYVNSVSEIRKTYILKNGKFKMASFISIRVSKGHGIYEINWKDSTIVFKYKILQISASREGKIFDKIYNKLEVYKIKNTETFSFDVFRKITFQEKLKRIYTNKIIKAL